MSDKCPKCGAPEKRGYNKSYKCESHYYYWGNNTRLTFDESRQCLRNQLAQSQARAEAAEARVRELAFAVRRLYEHVRDFIDNEKYCQFCETEWDGYCTPRHPHLSTCAFRDVEKVLNGESLASAIPREIADAEKGIHDES